jgi:flagellar hook protein FlgE
VLRSLFSGITGLRAHQTLMDIVSNNIANVNTTGFKTSTAVFEDTLSQTLRNSNMPSASLGGTNPAQVGLGVKLAGISNNFGQGSAQNTGKATDLMIQGDGFFVVKNGSQQAYSRAGAFNFDTNGNLVNSEGMLVQGWMGDGKGNVNTDTPLTNIQIPTGVTVAPTPTTVVGISGNIAADAPSVMTLGATAYDASGAAHALTITLTPNAGAYDVTVTDAVAGSTDAPSQLTFTNGAYTAGGDTITLADGTAFTLDLSKITNYGGPKSLSVTKVDGAASGSLQQFQIDQYGSIVGLFSNSQKLVLGKIAVANFNNPSGLQKIGSTAFVESSNSGLPQIGSPDTGGRGQLLGSTLEMSNVDLAQEFTNMIIAQRGFQANSRVITTSDQMLQDLVDLKR